MKPLHTFSLYFYLHIHVCKRKEITQFLKSDPNTMSSIYQRKLKRADANNMSIYRRKMLSWVQIEENRW